MGGACLLRAVLDGEAPKHDVLPSSPEAKLGSLVHEAISDRSRPARQALLDLRRQILEGRHTVRSACKAGDVPLRDAVGASRCLARIPLLPERKNDAREHETATADRQGSYSRQTERSLISADGELQGRADLVEFWEDDSARVTDFKTGRIWVEPETVSPGYQLQVEAYGHLLIEAALASKVVIRLVGADGVWETPLYQEARVRVQRHVAVIRKRAPRDTDLEARDLASFGEGCRWCRHRLGCGSYQDSAIAAWSSGEQNWKLPLDTWGTVVSIESERNDLVRVQLLDAAGRAVCIFGVPQALVRNARAGSRVAFFSLRQLTRSSRGHPHNFRIVWDRIDECAHAAYVLLADENDSESELDLT